MTIEKLVKYCLQYLEQSSDTKVMDKSMADLETNDEFAEYLNNIEHSIYMGLTRYASSEVIPIAEYEFSGQNNAYITDNDQSNGKRLFHRIFDIFALDNEGNMLNDVEYIVVGKKVMIKNYEDGLTYVVLYHPTIFNFNYYMEKNALATYYNIELEDLGITDEMAINLKYLVYSDLKMEENASVANTNKNYFENYLEELKANQLDNHTNQARTMDWGDKYQNDEDNTVDDWSDKYGY